MSSRGHPKIFSACEFKLRMVPASSVWTKASSAVSMMLRASCSLSCSVSWASRLSVMSRPMKKCRCTGSDQVAIHDSITTRPSLWMNRVSEFLARRPRRSARIRALAASRSAASMNSPALWPTISSGRNPRIVSTLGLTWVISPSASVMMIRSWEVSKMRRRSSVCWRSARSVLRRSVTSWAIFDTPTIWPAGFLIGEMLSRTSTMLPSLCSLTASSCWTICSPRPILRRVSRNSFVRSGGTIRLMFFPTASSAEWPNIFSAAGFQPVMVPSSDWVTIASFDDSTAAL